MSNTWRPSKLDRGVYWEAATKGGKPQAIAVDSNGEEIERVRLCDGRWISEVAAIDHLWNLLDTANPVTVPARVLGLVP